MCLIGPCTGLCRVASHFALCHRELGHLHGICHRERGHPGPCHPPPPPPAPAPYHPPAPAPAPAPCQPVVPTPAPAPCHPVAPAPAPAPCQKEPEPQGCTVTFVPGMCYVLLNARCGAAMDLSGDDNRSLIGYPMHGGPNQQWDFVPFGSGYAIRCMRPAKDGHALYLTVEGCVRDDVPVVAGPYPVAWAVEQIKEGITISWPNSNYVFHLSDSTASTKIKLMPRRPGELCKVWRLDARGLAPDVFNTTANVSASSTCAVETFTAGKFHVLLNGLGGIAVDVSGTSSTGVIANEIHGEDSQQWEIIKFGLGYAIRSSRTSADGQPLYLTLDGGGARDGAQIVVGTHPVAWNVEQLETGVKISWPNSNFVFHLAKEGAQAVHNTIRLLPHIPGELCQLWRTTHVTAACK